MENEPRTKSTFLHKTNTTLYELQIYLQVKHVEILFENKQMSIDVVWLDGILAWALLRTECKLFRGLFEIPDSCEMFRPRLEFYSLKLVSWGWYCWFSLSMNLLRNREWFLNYLSFQSRVSRLKYQELIAFHRTNDFQHPVFSSRSRLPARVFLGFSDPKPFPPQVTIVNNQRGARPHGRILFSETFKKRSRRVT